MTAMQTLTIRPEPHVLYDEPGDEVGTLRLTLLVGHDPAIEPSGWGEHFDPGSGAETWLISATVEVNGLLAHGTFDAHAMATDWLADNPDEATRLVARAAADRDETGRAWLAEQRAEMRELAA